MSVEITCPTCRNPQRLVTRDNSAYFPFCSSECQGRDLAGWVFEQYRVDAGSADDEADQDLDLAE